MCNSLENLLNDISKEIYQKFIINKTVVGVQQEDGVYYATKAPVTPFLIKSMLKSGASLGTYQQLTWLDMLKWVCFDFDCKKDAGGTLKELKEKYIIPFIKKLDSLNIQYLIEFSGRRGFHIWILFNRMIKKNLGFQIQEKLLGDLLPLLLEDAKYGLDRYPKALSGKKKNKYGAMVKIPLSRHQKGSYSYFIRDVDLFSYEKIESLKNSFLEEQLDYLKIKSYNEPQEIIKKLNIDENETRNEESVKRQYVIPKDKFTLKQLEDAFISDSALEIIWENIINGCMTINDRKVMLGTFAHIKQGDELLWHIFKMQKNFSPSITNEEINKNKNFYFPLTMRYLHDIYGVEPCDDCRSVAEFLLQKIGLPYDSCTPEKKYETSLIEDIVKKEWNYFHYNDEVISIKIEQDFHYFSFFDVSECKRLIKEIYGNLVYGPKDIEYFIYCRKEENKERMMVSLGVKERVITTALIYELVKRLQKGYDSYSYHLNLTAGGDVFFPWIKSWDKFVQDVSLFFNLKIFEDYNFIKADLKSCYDNIYLPILQHTLLKNVDIKTNEGKEIENICNYLISFNDCLMKDSANVVKGVPQGPAYARVLVEYILDSILNEFFEKKEYKNKVKIYRYVDDMFIFHDMSQDCHEVLKELSQEFEKYGLYFNKEKTKIWGKISDLPTETREEYGKINQLMYDVQQEKKLLIEDSPVFAMDKFISRKSQWDINDANFLLSDCVDSQNRVDYVNKYLENITESEFGRGSIFRKFYNIVFSNNKILNFFVKKEIYRKIPINSINFKNFIHCLYTNMQKKIILENSKMQLKVLVDFFSKKSEVTETEKDILHVLHQY